ncbi:hypothetical protein OsI_26042 [Oryza sativa Indica Group]|uniref:CG-1 domain-containing protein n=2 Tax=Oryza sativa TaxID=4530 RepID=B9FXA5_ORYSJ|nr:hypothetical protein OsI_26042 [Oryza sativa Indica Group]EEE67192.1 hypothetical protein OsJ_24294 [Oryza sativa Japonica Group]
MAGAGGWDPLVGSEIHGFLTYPDLNYEKLVAEAAARWFRPNEIYAILANHARFKIHAQPVDKPGILVHRLRNNVMVDFAMVLRC